MGLNVLMPGMGDLNSISTDRGHLWWFRDHRVDRFGFSQDPFMGSCACMCYCLLSEISLAGAGSHPPGLLALVASKYTHILWTWNLGLEFWKGGKMWAIMGIKGK